MNDGCLFLIPTPIGNYDDITIRSLDTLKKIDILLCEDTRETGKLLAHYGIKKKLVSCHEYNEEKMIDKVLSMLDEHLLIGLVTDQGTPIISDPGYKIVEAISKTKYKVISLPGTTAFVPALTLSALPPQPFLFYGFLNAKAGKQKTELEKLKFYPFTIIFYESPHRIMNTLRNMLEIFGDRRVCLVRELTKKYETVYHLKISELLKLDALKGEMVLVIEGNQNLNSFEEMSIIDHVNIYVQDGMNLNDAMKKVASERGISKSIIYKEYNKEK